MRVLANGSWAEVKQGGIIDALVGDTITVGGVNAPMTHLDGASEVGVTIDGADVLFGAPGRYHLRSQDGFDLFVVACEVACLDRIPGGLQSSGGAQRDKRAILRSVCQHGEFPFNGLADELSSRSFMNHGA